ncbi:unnamed protein product [Cochlearia groenlandica]
MNTIFAVVNQTKSDTCVRNGGFCEGCGARCRFRFGPLTQTKCVGIVCKCIYDCPPHPPEKLCVGGAGVCTQACPDDCCNGTCSQKYIAGSGSCQSMGSYRLCQCQYPC